MRSEEAHIGRKVRVHQDHRRLEFRGMSGTIAQRYGAPSYLALEVRFGNGRSDLFWHHELEDADGALPVDRPA